MLTIPKRGERYPTLHHSMQLIRHVAPYAIQQIVDVGVQVKTDFLMEVFPDKFHHLFEPVKNYRARLEENYRNAGIAFALYQVALSDVDGLLYLHHISKDGSGQVTHSQIKSAPDWETPFLVTVEEIQARRLDSMFTAENLGDLSYIVKLDVDGAEERIIAGGKRVISHASFVVIEVPVTTKPFCSRIAALEQCGFSVFDICDNAYYFGQLSQVDVVMINDRLRDAELKFRPWQYSEGQVVWDKWQHGFQSLKGQPVGDPFI